MQTERSKIIETGRRTLNEEAMAIKGLLPYIDDNFANSVEVILASTGRVIVTGIGKSLDIGRKFVSTLNSTGTPAFFFMPRMLSTETWAWCAPMMLWFVSPKAEIRPK